VVPWGWLFEQWALEGHRVGEGGGGRQCAASMVREDSTENCDVCLRQ
jgi:hypothetical protein